MSQDSNLKNLLSERAKFIILKTDFCLAGVCAAVRRANSGMRSLTVLTLAEDILSGVYAAQPLTMKDIQILTNQGGVSITTYLSKTSKRFPLLLKELEGYKGLKARSDCLKNIIEKPHLAAFAQQLESRVIAHQVKIPAMPSAVVATSISTKEDTRSSDHIETEHSFILEKPAIESKPFNAQRTLAQGLLAIAR